MGHSLITVKDRRNGIEQTYKLSTVVKVERMPGKAEPKSKEPFFIGLFAGPDAATDFITMYNDVVNVEEINE